MLSESWRLLCDKDKWQPFFIAGEAARIMPSLYFYIASMLQVIKAKTRGVRRPRSSSAPDPNALLLIGL